MTMKKTTAAMFEEYFQEWLEEIQKPEIMVSSDTADYVDNEPYKKIIKLGKSSLPSIMTKIAQGYFFLNHAVSEITGVKISEIISGGMKPTSQQEISRLWLTWWKKQKHTTKERHVRLVEFVEYKDKHQLFHKNFFDVPNISDRETMERYALPSVMARIRKNLDKSIPYLSFLNDPDVRTSIHVIPDVAFIFAMTKSNFPLSTLLSASGVLPFLTLPDRKIEGNILEEIE